MTESELGGEFAIGPGTASGWSALGGLGVGVCWAVRGSEAKLEAELGSPLPGGFLRVPGCWLPAGMLKLELCNQQKGKHRSGRCKISRSTETCVRADFYPPLVYA